MATATTTEYVPATEPQESFIRGLLAKRDVPEGIAADVVGFLAVGLSKSQASFVIGRLQGYPTKPRTFAPSGQELPDVPEGRYAVEVDGTLGFFHVDRPTEGNWAGRTFVNVQASDELYPVRGARAYKVLALIAADVKGATLRYGLELEVCGVCGKTLTHEDSRALGIGPKCRAKRGY